MQVRRPLALLTVYAGLAMLLVGATQSPTLLPTAGTGCVPPPVAHRGDSARAPENTLPAYRRALALGVTRLEVDVRFTSDGVPVLMHDPTVGRTTDGRGPVAALPLAAVRALDAGSWFSARYAGVRVPTLHEVLDHGRTRGATYLVELKVRPSPQEMDNVLNELRWLGMLDRVRVTSFDEQTIVAVQAAQPGLRTAIIDSPTHRLPGSVLPYGDTYLVHYLSVTRERAAQWRAAGIEIRPWTVDEVRAWRRMAFSGAGQVITNRPKAYLSWARSICSTSGSSAGGPASSMAGDSTLGTAAP